MDIKFEKLSLFFERVKTLSFWQRIFGWTSFKALSYEAYNEFNDLVASFNTSKDNIDRLSHDKVIAETNYRNLEKNHNSVLAENVKLKEEITRINHDLVKFRDENTGFKSSAENRLKEYENKVAILHSMQKRSEENEAKIHSDREREISEKFNLMKQTWAKHESHVESAIKDICKKHTIEYIDKEKVPFKGKPDNSIKICDEYIIFDAKSPASDDLENFPTYIRTQAESVKKYIKEENVKKDIFLVIPSNTIEVVNQFTFNMADYYVYVVTPDSLEPIILSLKKLEDYEFLNELTPEERENICRVIGKFAHAVKRRMQIDVYFMRHFIEILAKSEAELPKDIFDKAVEIETSEKLNPPQEKRAKQIPSKELEADARKIIKEVEARAIASPPSIEKSIESIPLYNIEEKDKR
ncbi:MAG: hypothetical protein A3A86_04125 [Elusimicrobia bacterium RIFCSPLOWO2_01_FULL_60_11]|nr:MAG: hypothetical protein A3A86_04125 [Elusimicrobia bacterium RIFCSPLOWO2_01_FULL_60_11]